MTIFLAVTNNLSRFLLPVGSPSANRFNSITTGSSNMDDGLTTKPRALSLVFGFFPTLFPGGMGISSIMSWMAFSMNSFWWASLPARALFGQSKPFSPLVVFCHAQLVSHEAIECFSRFTTFLGRRHGVVHPIFQCPEQAVSQELLVSFDTLPAIGFMDFHQPLAFARPFGHRDGSH